ncbi:MAG TPA: pilus assembly PilX N-terminal domain-containing protein [Gemmatimonadales bacterium]|jgi:hypothetical protein
MRSADRRVAEALPCRPRSERGIALVIAIVALVVIGAIVAGTFFVSSLEQKTAGNAVFAAQAYQSAEAGIVGTVAHWDPAYNTLPVDASITPPADSIARGTYANVTISRLNPNLFLVRSVGTRRGATQTLASVLHLVTVDPGVSAALTTATDVGLTGPVAIDGAELAPAGWTACTPAAGAAGIRTAGAVHPSGYPGIAGAPATAQHDSSITDTVIHTPFDKLRGVATLSLSGGSGAGHYSTFTNVGPSASGSPVSCNRLDPNNWGEPLRTGGHIAACTGYAPVVYIDGNARIDGSGRGQGILLVGGDLSLSAGFSWVGLVIATGEVTITDGNGAVTGAIFARGANFVSTGSVAGAPAVSYSKCALDYVLRAAAVARPLPTRAWLQVF